MKIVSPSVTLLHATPDPLRVLERAGRICYQSTHKTRPCPTCEGVGTLWDGLLKIDVCCSICKGARTDIESARDFVRMVLKRGHESVVEHVSAGVLIVTDRGVTHELVRHRLASFSQESTRYCDYNKDQFGGELSFIEPPFDGDDADYHQRAWTWSMGCSEAAYKNLRVNQCPPELARSVLPNSLKSELAMTCNAREWRHFLHLRLAPAAHPQMREVARLVAKALFGWCPELFDDVVTADGALR